MIRKLASAATVAFVAWGCTDVPLSPPDVDQTQTEQVAQAGSNYIVVLRNEAGPSTELVSIIGDLEITLRHSHDDIGVSFQLEIAATIELAQKMGRAVSHNVGIRHII